MRYGDEKRYRNLFNLPDKPPFEENNLRVLSLISENFRKYFAMDKYHIYEEIGKGEFSQVFKGREKKKIEYVAIKRIDKSMMTKVGHFIGPHHVTKVSDT